MISKLQELMRSRYLLYFAVMLHLLLLLCSWPLAGFHSESVKHNVSINPARFAGIEVLDDTQRSSFFLIMYGLIPFVYLPAMLVTIVIWGFTKLSDSEAKYFRIFPFPVCILSIVYYLLWFIL